MLVIGDEGESDLLALADGVAESVDGPVPFAFYFDGLPVLPYSCDDPGAALLSARSRGGADPALLQVVGGDPAEVFPLEGPAYHLRRHFPSRLLGNGLHQSSHLGVHLLRQGVAVLAFQDESDSPLAGLAVDANDRLVSPSDIVGIDRQIGDFPGG
jgi:hypothetical protein